MLLGFEEEILATVRDPLLVLDANLTVMGASPSFYARFRASPENTIGRRIYELGDAAWNIPKLRTLLEEILPQNAHFDDFAVEHEFPAPLGRRSMLLNARRFPPKPGVPAQYMLLAIEDVTIRHQAEEAAKRHRIELEVMLRSIGDAVIATDKDARVTFMNPTAEELTGWTVEEATEGGGRDLAEVFRIVNESTRAVVESPVAKSLRLGVVVGLANHTVLIRRDGTEAAIDDSAAPIEMPAENGEPKKVIGVVMVFRDITERRATEKRIEVSEVRYRRLFEAARDGILLIDPATRKITDANPFMEELLDTPRTNLIGRELFEIGLIKDREESKRAFDELLEVGQIRYEDLPLTTPTGRRRDVEFVSNIYQENAHPIIQCNIRDITERVIHTKERERLLERERAAHLLADSANRSKDIFLATLSHELRTPLNAILGWAVMLRTRGPVESRSVDGEVEHGLAVIERNARAQGKLIEDVLDVARVVSGKFELDPHPTDLAVLVFAAVDAVRPTAASKGIGLEVMTSGGPDFDSLNVMIDASRMSQAVLNLLNNAVKFTPKGGRVTVRLERDDDVVRIVVRDSGKGIRSEFLPFIFDRFKQADEGSARIFGGLGLGLTIVRHIVELHGGAVSAESDGDGKGSTFTLELPVHAPGSPLHDGELARRRGLMLDSHAGGAGQDIMLNGLRVLVVDDERDGRDIVRMALESAGATVMTASSAQEGYELASRKADPPDVLVSDIGMPGEDGCSLMRRLRTDGVESRGLPAVALTAFASLEDRRRVLLAGFQVHLPKPVDPHELTMVVGSLAGRTGFRSAPQGADERA